MSLEWAKLRCVLIFKARLCPFSSEMKAESFWRLLNAFKFISLGGIPLLLYIFKNQYSPKCLPWFHFLPATEFSIVGCRGHVNSRVGNVR